MKNQKGFSVIEGLLIIFVLGMIGGTGWYVWQSNEKADSSYQKARTSSELKNVDLSKLKDQPVTAEALPETKTVAKPVPKQTVTPTPKPSRCTNKGNAVTTQVLLDNGYTSTKKFYDALEFAGLLDRVNQQDTVVFAMNDWVFENKLTKAQVDFMYASPENMKSVLQWHIVPSCVVFSGDIDSKTTTVPIQTLGGTVTHSPGSPGNIDGVQMAMWDFYSRTGAMHLITGFIKPPAI